MKKLPPFVYAIAFWRAISMLAAGVLALLVYFNVIPLDYALTPAAILAFIQAVLQFFKINTELKMRELLKLINSDDNATGEY